jgi:hypothetical protein
MMVERIHESNPKIGLRVPPQSMMRARGKGSTRFADTGPHSRAEYCRTAPILVL